MKIHYNEEFKCYETTECHKTDSIELDGVKLIPITELEKLKTEINEQDMEIWLIGVDVERGYWIGIKHALKRIDYYISKMKGE